MLDIFLLTFVSGVVMLALVTRYRTAGNDWSLTLAPFAEADPDIWSSNPAAHLEAPDCDGDRGNLLEIKAVPFGDPTFMLDCPTHLWEKLCLSHLYTGMLCQCCWSLR